MFISRTVTKKVLENLIRETFLTYGSSSSSSLLDSLKFLGFHYATNGGISITIEDLKTPQVKDLILNQTTEKIKKVSNNWQQGLLTDIERFQTIIDSWNVATEELKNQIVEYYQNFDPANNLYIMAFSGARGNMSQVRQLVGMRGLMADQSGKIIDLPIQANFREGLTPIDYIVSAYGARKGIVDTALKTADSGYLTRRLIYIAQDLVIREKDCKTKKGILILFEKKRPVDGFLGRYLLSARKYSGLKRISLLEEEILFTPTKLNELKTEIPLVLNFRSSLTCNSIHSVCQKCYGWDLSQQKLVPLGEAVGIIAAQSIGEPGTQLTMRTFHTGGIFTGETVQQIVSPFSGTFFFPERFKGIPFRTNHGKTVFKLKTETEFRLLDWQGYQEIISLSAGSYLYLSESCYLRKGQVIAEYSPQINFFGERRLKPLFSSIGGEVLYEKMIVNHIPQKQNKKKHISIIQKSGTLWILAGSLFECQSEALLSFRKKTSHLYPIVKLKVCSPFEGYFYFDSEQNMILSTYEYGEVIFSSEFLEKKITDDFVGSFCPLLRSYQKIDKGTLLGYWYLFSKEDHLVYQIKMKKKEDQNQFCMYSDQKSWKLFLEEPEQKLIGQKIKKQKTEQKGKDKLKKKDKNKKKEKLSSPISSNKSFVSSFRSFPMVLTLPLACVLKSNKKVRKDTLISSTLSSHRVGVFSFRKGSELIFHQAAAYFMNSGTTLSYQQNDFIQRNSLLANLISYTQRTEDIVQGLPKIEKLVEASVPAFEAILSESPGLVLDPLTPYSDIKFQPEYSKRMENLWVFQCEKLPIQEEKETVMIEPEIKKKISVLKRFFLKDLLIRKEEGKYKQCCIKQYITDRPYSILGIKRLKMIHPSKTDVFAYVAEKEFLFEENLLYIPVLDPEWGNNFLKQKEREKEEKELEKNWKSKEEWELEEEDRELEEKNKESYIKAGRRKNQLFTKNSKKKTISKDISTIYTWYDPNGFLKKEAFIFEYIDGQQLYLKKETLKKEYFLAFGFYSSYKEGEFLDLGEPISNGTINMHDLLNILFSYHRALDGIQEGTLRSLAKLQLLLVNGIQAIYHSQGVIISNKHIEMIVRQMTSKVRITKTGATPFLIDELVSVAIMSQISEAFWSTGFTTKIKTIPKYEPKIISATKCSLMKNSFLSAASFQETRRVLAKAAIEGKSDWLRGLKESIINGRLSPSGSSFFNYKNNLDHVYSFKQRYKQNKIKKPNN